MPSSRKLVAEGRMMGATKVRMGMGKHSNASRLPTTDYRPLWRKRWHLYVCTSVKRGPTPTTDYYGDSVLGVNGKAANRAPTTDYENDY